MELWNKIVHDLKFCKANNVSEDEYQKEIERILELLGWWRMGARKSKSPIPWGSAKDLLPDIQLFKNEKEVLVIEIKRPHNILSQRQIGQLDSYMHSLKLPVGLYIGENIQLFYEAPDEKFPTSVYKVEITEDNEKGRKLCNLLNYDTFDYDELIKFCISQKERILHTKASRKRLNDFFSDAHCEENIKLLLKEKFIDEGLDESLVIESLDKMRLLVQHPEQEITNNHIYIQTSSREVYRKNANKPKQHLDHTHYSINGQGNYGKGQLALKIVKMFVKDNPHLTFKQLEEILPLQIRELSFIQDWKETTTDKSKHTRWFENSDDLMHSSDGVTFAFTTQIGKGNIDAMIDFGKKQGYQIKVIP